MDDNTIMAILLVGRLTAAVAAILSAAFLASHGKEGWGWFLLVAVLIGWIGITKETEQ